MQSGRLTVSRGLESGGHIEMQDVDMPYRSDDGTLTEDHELRQWGSLFLEASEKLGRRMDKTPSYKQMMEKAGFVDVVETQFKWPLNQWPKESYFKKLGEWTLINLDTNLEGLCMALFTRGLGWTTAEVNVFCTSVRKQLRDRNIHAYCAVYVPPSRLLHR
jgi:hypothetical protein